MENSQPPTTIDQTVWRQGEILQLEITDLTDSGDGIGRADRLVVFVPDTVPGDRLLVRLLQVKSNYAHGIIKEILTRSPHRTRPHCIVADKCGGCQWQQIKYDYQLIAKHTQVVEALERIGGFVHPLVESVLAADSPLAYRNKSTYPLGVSANGQVQAGYYQKGSHQLINLNQCPVQDPNLNPLLAEVKLDIQQRGWTIYHEHLHQGLVRHLSLRIGRRTGEILLTLVVKDWNLPGITAQAEEWLERYPGLVGVSLNWNSDRTNTIFGSQTRCIAGVPYLVERFAGLEFQVRPDTFFQISTETAEALLQVIQTELNLQGHEVIVDAYCGIGTLTLPLAKLVHQAIGLEVQPAAIEQAISNTQYNDIKNATFQVGTVENSLPNLTITPDIVLLDPPRKGCGASVIKTLLTLRPQRIVYISCKVATLARDLKLLCDQGIYTLVKVQPADFFPQTAHVEAVAFLALTHIG